MTHVQCKQTLVSTLNYACVQKTSTHIENKVVSLERVKITTKPGVGGCLTRQGVMHEAAMSDTANKLR